MKAPFLPMRAPADKHRRGGHSFSLIHQKVGAGISDEAEGGGEILNLCGVAWGMGLQL